MRILLTFILLINYCFVSISQNNQQFTLTRALVKTKFLEFVPNISNGRELSPYFNSTDGHGFKIFLSDLNGDNLLDAIVDYSFEPNHNDFINCGNSCQDFPGLIVFVNTGKNIIISDYTTEFSESYYARVTNVSSGVIFLKYLDWGIDDPRCCPSIEKKFALIFRNGKLEKLNR